MNLLCFGYGQVAKNLVSNLLKKKVNLNLTISTRENTSIKKLNNFEFENLEFSENAYDKKILDKLNEYDHILISVPPINSKDLFLEHLASHITENSNIKSILYLSSTSVYGNHNGAWVNEDSETKPRTKMGIDRLNIENKWIEFSKKKKLPIQIFRLAGIYSEKNNAVTRLKNKQSFLVIKENHFFSRIHVKDISEILYLSLVDIKKNQIFNLADNKPASSFEVTSYASKLLGCELPTKINFEDLEDSVLKDFYRDSKKVSNEKVKKELNYDFIYPSYKEGLLL